MFLLDTNVLSAMMRPEPDPAINHWISGQIASDMFTAAVCEAEILAGLAVMPLGRRRADYENAARAMFRQDFGGRVLPFDSDAAANYADIHAVRRRAGRPVATIDLMIAAIARTRGAAVVTRNVPDFDLCGLRLINPWTE